MRSFQTFHKNSARVPKDLMGDTPSTFHEIWMLYKRAYKQRSSQLLSPVSAWEISTEMPFKELVIAILFVVRLTQGSAAIISPTNGHIGNAPSGSQNDTTPEQAELGNHDSALDYPGRINTTHEDDNLSVGSNNVHKSDKETSDTFPQKAHHEELSTSVKTKIVRNAPPGLFAPCSKEDEHSLPLVEDHGSAVSSLDAFQPPPPSTKQTQTVSTSILPISLEGRNEQTSSSNYPPALSNRYPEGQEDHALATADVTLHATPAVHSVQYSQIPSSSERGYDITSLVSENSHSTEMVPVEEVHRNPQGTFIPEIAIYFPLSSPSPSNNLNDELKFGNSFSQGDGEHVKKTPHLSLPLQSQYTFTFPGSSDGQLPTDDSSQAQSRLSADGNGRNAFQRGVLHGIESFTGGIYYGNHDPKLGQTVPTGKYSDALFSIPEISVTQSHPPTEHRHTPTYAAQAASSGKNSDCGHQRITNPLNYHAQNHKDSLSSEIHRNSVPSIPTQDGGNTQSADSTSILSSTGENGGFTEKFPFSTGTYQRGRNYGRSSHPLLVSSAASTVNGNEHRGSQGLAPLYPADDSGSPNQASMHNKELGFSVSGIHHSTNSENHAETLSSPPSISLSHDGKYEGYNPYASSAPFVSEKITREGTTQSAIPVKALSLESEPNYRGDTSAPSTVATLAGPSAWKHTKPAPSISALQSFSSGIHEAPSIPDSLTPGSSDLYTKSMLQPGSSFLPAPVPLAEMYITNGRAGFNTQSASTLPNERDLGNSRALSPLVPSVVTASSNEGFSYSFRSSSTDPSEIRKDQSRHLQSAPLTTNVYSVDRLPSATFINHGSHEGKHMQNFAVPSDLSGGNARALGGKENTYGAKMSSVSLNTRSHLNLRHSASPVSSVFTEINSRTLTQGSGPILSGPVTSAIQNELGYGKPRPTPATHGVTSNNGPYSSTLTQPVLSGNTFEGSLPALPDYSGANFGGFVSSTQPAYSSPETSDHTASQTLTLSVQGWSGTDLRDSSIVDRSVAQQPSERDSTSNNGGQLPRDVQPLPLDTGNNGKRKDTFSTGITTFPSTHTCGGNSQLDEAGSGKAASQYGSGGQQHSAALVEPGADARPLFQSPPSLTDQRKVVLNAIYESRPSEPPAQRNADQGSSNLLPTRNYSPETAVATQAKDPENRGRNRGAGRIDNGVDTKAYEEGAFAIPPAINSVEYSQHIVGQNLDPLNAYGK